MVLFDGFPPHDPLFRCIPQRAYCRMHLFSSPRARRDASTSPPPTALPQKAQEKRRNDDRNRPTSAAKISQNPPRFSPTPAPLSPAKTPQLAHPARKNGLLLGQFQNKIITLWQARPFPRAKWPRPRRRGKHRRTHTLKLVYLSKATI